MVRLSPQECIPADTRIEQLVELRADVDSSAMLLAARQTGSLLPTRLADRLWELHLGVGPAWFVVARPSLAEEIGPTPAHWNARTRRGTVRHDLWLLVVMSQLGDPMCWTGLQGGRLLNDIMPIRGNDREQTGHGSETNLEFHVEDAFDDLRCDALGLLCLRNDHRTSSTVCDVSTVPVMNSDRNVLLEPRFSIAPDVEHARNSPGLEEVRTSVFGADGMLRLDPVYTRARPGDAQAAAALSRLAAGVRSQLVDVTLVPGDLLVIDNRRAVHGRRAFPASHDGRDRWLRKATVTRDLRRSRSRRGSPNARAVSPVNAAGWQPSDTWQEGASCDQHTSTQHGT